MNPTTPPPEPYFHAFPWFCADSSSAKAKEKREKLRRADSMLLSILICFLVCLYALIVGVVMSLLSFQRDGFWRW